MKIIVADNKQHLGALAAEEGAQAIQAALKSRGEANIIVATGASQFDTLAALVAQPDLDWSRITGFHLDEYLNMTADHPASFRKYLRERFVDKVPLRAFHYVNGEAADPQAECQRLGELIQQHPIDVAFVGIGENAHLAFNDPPADFETDAPYLVVNLDDACRQQQFGEGWFETFEAVPQQAISMSVKQILKSKTIICSVPDERKADAVCLAVEGEVTPDVPASILQTHEGTTLYLDPPAASRLKSQAGK